MPLRIIRNDITKVKADIIVNTANPLAVVGNGTDRAIYEAAGWDELLKERKKIGEISEGEAHLTPAFNLDAQYIIHTVGPVYIDGKHHEADLLKNCYIHSLLLAKEHNCSSIAFPIISSGTYRFPKGEAVIIAMSAINEFLVNNDSDLKVTLVVFDPESVNVSNKLFDSIEEFIDDEDVLTIKDQEYSNRLSNRNTSKLNRRIRSSHIPVSHEFDIDQFMDQQLDDAIKDNRKFRELLMDLMIEKHLSDKEVYGTANISKQTFNKIKNHNDYHPSKKMVLSLVFSLKLNSEEAVDFLARANYAFNMSDPADRLLKACIDHQFYDLKVINTKLFYKNLPTLLTDWAY